MKIYIEQVRRATDRVTGQTTSQTVFNGTLPAETGRYELPGRANNPTVIEIEAGDKVTLTFRYPNEKFDTAYELEAGEPVTHAPRSFGVGDRFHIELK